MDPPLDLSLSLKDKVLAICNAAVSPNEEEMDPAEAEELLENGACAGD